ncbi:hypothetical protein BJ912DRAFT_958872, partial [Pholiota molesta]
ETGYYDYAPSMNIPYYQGASGAPANDYPHPSYRPNDAAFEGSISDTEVSFEDPLQDLAFQEGRQDIVGMGHGYSPSLDVPHYQGDSASGTPATVSTDPYAHFPAPDNSFWGRHVDRGRGDTLPQVPTPPLPRSSGASATTSANPYPHGAYDDSRRPQLGNSFDSAPDRWFDDDAPDALPPVTDPIGGTKRGKQCISATISPI